MKLQKTIKAIIRYGEQSGYVADCLEILVVTQAATLDEITQNLQEAVQLHIEGEDLEELGLYRNPTIIVTMDCLCLNLVASPALKSSIFRQASRYINAIDLKPYFYSD